MKKYEILVGDSNLLDFLAKDQEVLPPHPLQERVEEAVQAMLTADEQEIFYMRFGEHMSIRKIAKALGYSSHQIIQVKLERIKRKVREHIERN